MVGPLPPRPARRHGLPWGGTHHVGLPRSEASPQAVNDEGTGGGRTQGLRHWLHLLDGDECTTYVKEQNYSCLALGHRAGALCAQGREEIAPPARGRDVAIEGDTA